MQDASACEISRSAPASGDGAAFGWFTPPDLDLLYQAVNQLAPKSVILVGGQALSFWVDYFNIDIPDELGRSLTQDADFLGSHQDALQLWNWIGQISSNGPTKGARESLESPFRLIEAVFKLLTSTSRPFKSWRSFNQNDTPG